MRVLGISGSLRHNSYNTALLRNVGEVLEAEGAHFEIYDGLRNIPPFDEDEEAFPADAVSRLRRGDRGRGRRLLHDSRVQLLDPWRTEERARLGVAPVRDECHAQQTGRRRRR